MNFYCVNTDIESGHEVRVDTITYVIQARPKHPQGVWADYDTYALREYAIMRCDNLNRVKKGMEFRLQMREG